MKAVENTGIPAREAVQIATRYLAHMRNLPAVYISLEEIEVTDDRKTWLVTLGHPRSYEGPVEEYKLIKVDAGTGEVISMKMRIIE
jgi:predicted small secreted protein